MSNSTMIIHKEKKVKNKKLEITTISQHAISERVMSEYKYVVYIDSMDDIQVDTHTHINTQTDIHTHTLKYT
jgi:hypothetical protein